MGLLSRIRDAFRPGLRNRPGRMAWIKGVRSDMGAEALNNRAVKTLYVEKHGLWVIDPPQHFRCTRDCLFGVARRFIEKGAMVSVEGIADDLLEPWKDIGDGAQDESHLYLPPVPTHTPSKEPNHA